MATVLHRGSCAIMTGLPNEELPMAQLQPSTLDAMRKNDAWLLEQWNADLASSGATRDTRLSAEDLRRQSTEALRLLVECAGRGGSAIGSDAWSEGRTFLEKLS